METLERNGIKPFAISYDPQDTLRAFAERFGITYPLLSDESSSVIREFGILNADIPNDHEWFGVPYPGTYMIGNDGLVIEKSFFAEHGTRESVNDMLQEGFSVEDVERGEAQTVTTPHLTARAYFASPTIRPRQVSVLTVEMLLADGIHVNGRPLPEGYIPLELSLRDAKGVILDRIDYPEPEEMYLEALGEKLPVYTGRVEIKARCLGVRREQPEEIEVVAHLRYQACNDQECYLPQTITFPLRLQYQHHTR